MTEPGVAETNINQADQTDRESLDVIPQIEKAPEAPKGRFGAVLSGLRARLSGNSNIESQKSTLEEPQELNDSNLQGLNEEEKTQKIREWETNFSKYVAGLTPEQRDAKIAECDAIIAKIDAEIKNMVDGALGDITIQDRRMIADKDNLKKAQEIRKQRFSFQQSTTSNQEKDQIDDVRAKLAASGTSNLGDRINNQSDTPKVA